MLFLHQVQQGFCFIYSPSFSVAGVGPFDIDLHFAWQVWHFCTSTVLLRGRRGTLWHGWNESNSHTRRFFVLVSLWNAFFFQSLAPVSKSDVCVYGGVSMRCFILCSKVMQNGCVLKWCLRVCSKVILLPTREMLDATGLKSVAATWGFFTLLKKDCERWESIIFDIIIFTIFFKTMFDHFFDMCNIFWTMQLTTSGFSHVSLVSVVASVIFIATFPERSDLDRLSPRVPPAHSPRVPFGTEQNKICEATAAPAASWDWRCSRWQWCFSILMSTYNNQTSTYMNWRFVEVWMPSVATFQHVWNKTGTRNYVKSALRCGSALRLGWGVFIPHQHRCLTVRMWTCQSRPLAVSSVVRWDHWDLEKNLSMDWVLLRFIGEN